MFSYFKIFCPSLFCKKYIFSYWLYTHTQLKSLQGSLKFSKKHYTKCKQSILEMTLVLLIYSLWYQYYRSVKDYISFTLVWFHLYVVPNTSLNLSSHQGVSRYPAEVQKSKQSVKIASPRSQSVIQTVSQSDFEDHFR